ncbi:MAG: AAA family ATPase [Anaerolineae bacterium]|nr:AAA family ATPase [Anaerolineae bacterium]MDH7475005.1 BTAD domain-containing putative transcriptional regulator [Anaerolineae bacterium]
MAHLSLSCLGPFQVTLDGQPVMGFKSNKVRALLAYLAVEADRPHRREVLAGLLWPDWPDRDALSNLRYTLANLRQVIGDRTAEPPFLLITRDTIQFNPASDYWLDVTAFIDLIGLRDMSGLERAVAMYQGSFLEGFSVSDSPAFEEWALLTREQIGRQMLFALHSLAATYEQRGQYEQAQSRARRQVELEPWDEAAHQQLMRALALSGQRSAALSQYEICRRLLAEELGVEPAAETTRLYEQIRDGKLKTTAPSLVSPPDLTARLPPFLAEEAPPVEVPVFVARESELAQLEGFLNLALAGRGRVTFVTGEAGSGKTALLQEFTRRAQEAHDDLIVASGNCNAYTGIGDPYLPFRQILGLLTGDVEARWAAGAMTREHACRLWNTLPLTTQALVDAGPDLIDTFVPRAALLERAMTYAPNGTGWLNRLDELVERRPTTVSSAPGPQQSDLFQQYTRVLLALAQRAPLLLVVDDLQWADLGSISLLFHLGRQLTGSRILIVGAYRPEEVALGRDGARHPLEPVLNEFQRDFGHITVDLGQAKSRDFIEALLDSEPNRLGVAFREMLYRQTRGHPLFTIELLQGLQEREDLVQDPEGRWVEGPALDWETLPARVEAVIAERIGRLAEPLQAALRVACVEGEIFTAEVVARVRATDEREMLGRLSSELDRKHHLIRAESIQRVDDQLLSSYRFRHILFQRYLYSSLDEVERVYLHEQVGTALEGLYGAQEQVAAIAVQLALHFQKARITEKAIHYLRQAGERAVELSAYQEGIAHLTRGLALLMALPDSPGRAQQELALQLALGMAWIGFKAFSDPEVEKAYTRARELCLQTGKTPQICRVLGELSIMYYVRAEHQRARELAEEALSLAQQTEDPLLVAVGHWYLGFILFCLGEYTTALGHLEQVIAFYNPEQHHRSFVVLRGSDVGPSALAYAACCSWCLGYPNQALNRSQEALALARELGHPFSLADVLFYAGCMFNEMRRDAQAFKNNAEELMQIAHEKVPGWLGQGTRFWGKALAMLGQVQEGMVQIRQGMAIDQSVGIRLYLSETLGSLAEAQAKTGHPEEGLTTLNEALALVEQTDERHWEAELYRLKGELLLMQGDEAEAEASFQKAIEVARRQQARSWELRATVSLCRLWQKQSRADEARQMLAEIYGWFTEGFDTPDLKEAQALLESLS